MKKIISVFLVLIALFNGITTSAYYDTASGKLIKLSNTKNPITYSYTASKNEIVYFSGNVWTDAILHIEAYSDSQFKNKIVEDYTIVPNGDWAAAPTPRIYVKLDANKTVYIKAYADNPRDKGTDLSNVTIVLGVHKCIDLSSAEIKLPTSINEYGWKIFKDAFEVRIDGQRMSPGDYEILCNGENVEGKHLNTGKQTITISGIWSGFGKKDIEVNVVGRGDLTTATIQLSQEIYLYDGKEHFPSVTLKNNIDGALKENKDYIITYSGEGKSVGEYSINIVGTGNYQGEITRKYFVIPNESSVIPETSSTTQASSTTETSSTIGTSSTIESGNTKAPTNTVESEILIIDDENENTSENNDNTSSLLLITAITVIVLASITILTGVYFYMKNKGNNN